MTTKIEWVKLNGKPGETWNPMHGCTKLSDACLNCYAERMAKRLGSMDGTGYAPAPHHFDVTLHEDRLTQPFRWRESKLVFVCSMGDLFHDEVPYSFIAKVLDVVRIENHKHFFLMLTKRPKRMREVITYYLEELRSKNICDWDRIWNLGLGVTIEDRWMMDERYPELLLTPAALKFVSVEPMLDRVPLEAGFWLNSPSTAGPWYDWQGKMRERGRGIGGQQICGRPSGDIGWVQCGCETGPGRRPTNLDDVRQLRDECVEAKVPFFLKQLDVDGKIVKMPELDGVVWDQQPDFQALLAHRLIEQKEIVNASISSERNCQAHQDDSHDRG